VLLPDNVTVSLDAIVADNTASNLAIWGELYSGCRNAMQKKNADGACFWQCCVCKTKDFLPQSSMIFVSIPKPELDGVLMAAAMYGAITIHRAVACDGVLVPFQHMAPWESSSWFAKNLPGYRALQHFLVAPHQKNAMGVPFIRLRAMIHVTF
jgi:hypothetical protein